jgi:hypothetical protein
MPHPCPPAPTAPPSPHAPQSFNQGLWLEWLEQGRPIVGNGNPAFGLKLFDLNQARRCVTDGGGQRA